MALHRFKAVRSVVKNVKKWTKKGLEQSEKWSKILKGD